MNKSKILSCTILPIVATSTLPILQTFVSCNKNNSIQTITIDPENKTKHIEKNGSAVYSFNWSGIKPSDNIFDKITVIDTSSKDAPRIKIDNDPIIDEFNQFQVVIKFNDFEPTKPIDIPFQIIFEWTIFTKSYKQTISDLLLKYNTKIIAPEDKTTNVQTDITPTQIISKATFEPFTWIDSSATPQDLEANVTLLSGPQKFINIWSDLYISENQIILTVEFNQPNMLAGEYKLNVAFEWNEEVIFNSSDFIALVQVEGHIPDDTSGEMMAVSVEDSKNNIATINGFKVIHAPVNDYTKYVVKVTGLEERGKITSTSFEPIDTLGSYALHIHLNSDKILSVRDTKISVEIDYKDEQGMIQPFIASHNFTLTQGILIDTSHIDTPHVTKDGNKISIDVEKFLWVNYGAKMGAGRLSTDHAITSVQSDDGTQFKILNWLLIPQSEDVYENKFNLHIEIEQPSETNNRTVEFFNNIYLLNEKKTEILENTKSVTFSFSTDLI